MKPTKVVGIWIRVSTEDQVRGESPEHHEKRARLYAEAKGWEVKKVYRLDAVSGKSVMHTPEAQQMIHDIKKGLITGIIFSKLARLARNTKELLDFADIFRAADADLISLQEAIDTSTPAGRLFYTMIAAMAQWEREEIADRVAASVPVRAKMGKPLGGQAPFGYSWDNKELVINQDESPVRKLMYELFREHRRKNTVSRMLNAKGYRTRNGSLFSDTTIGRLLRDPTAKGKRIANYTKSLGSGKNWELKPQSDWIVLNCPAIITETLWNECNSILDEQEKKNKRPAKKTNHLFTGVVFCHCGGKMTVPHGGTKYACNKCRKNRISITDLEEIYYGFLKSFLITDENVSNFLSKTDNTIASKQEELENLEEKVKKTQAEKDKLVALYMAGEMVKEGFGNYFNPLEEQVKQMQNTIPELQAEIDYLKVAHLNSEQVISEAKNLYDRWPSLPEETKRAIIEQITDSIIIQNEDIHIKFAYTPSPPITPDSPHNFTGS